MASSSDSQQDEAPQLGPSHPISQADALPVPSTSETHPKGDLNTVESPQGGSIFKRWLQRKGNKGPASHKPNRRSGKARRPASLQPPSHSKVRPDTTNEGPSWMAVSALLDSDRMWCDEHISAGDLKNDCTTKGSLFVGSVCRDSSDITA